MPGPDDETPKSRDSLGLTIAKHYLRQVRRTGIKAGKSLVKDAAEELQSWQGDNSDRGINVDIGAGGIVRIESRRGTKSSTTTTRKGSEEVGKDLRRKTSMREDRSEDKVVSDSDPTVARLHRHRSLPLHLPSAGTGTRTRSKRSIHWKDDDSSTSEDKSLIVPDHSSLSESPTEAPLPARPRLAPTIPTTEPPPLPLRKVRFVEDKLKSAKPSSSASPSSRTRRFVAPHIPSFRSASSPPDPIPSRDPSRNPVKLADRPTTAPPSTAASLLNFSANISTLESIAESGELSPTSPGQPSERREAHPREFMPGAMEGQEHVVFPLSEERRKKIEERYARYRAENPTMQAPREQQDAMSHANKPLTAGHERKMEERVESEGERRRRGESMQKEGRPVENGAGVQVEVDSQQQQRDQQQGQPQGQQRPTPFHESFVRNLQKGQRQHNEMLANVRRAVRAKAIALGQQQLQMMEMMGFPLPVLEVRDQAQDTVAEEAEAEAEAEAMQQQHQHHDAVSQMMHGVGSSEEDWELEYHRVMQSAQEGNGSSKPTKSVPEHVQQHQRPEVYAPHPSPPSIGLTSNEVSRARHQHEQNEQLQVTSDINHSSLDQKAMPAQNNQQNIMPPAPSPPGPASPPFPVLPLVPSTSNSRSEHVLGPLTPAIPCPQKSASFTETTSTYIPQPVEPPTSALSGSSSQVPSVELEAPKPWPTPKRGYPSAPQIAVSKMKLPPVAPPALPTMPFGASPMNDEPPRVRIPVSSPPQISTPVFHSLQISAPYVPPVPGGLVPPAPPTGFPQIPRPVIPGPRPSVPRVLPPPVAAPAAPRPMLIPSPMIAPRPVVAPRVAPRPMLAPRPIPIVQGPAGDTRSSLGASSSPCVSESHTAPAPNIGCPASGHDPQATSPPLSDIPAHSRAHLSPTSPPHGSPALPQTPHIGDLSISDDSRPYHPAGIAQRHPTAPASDESSDSDHTPSPTPLKSILKPAPAAPSESDSSSESSYQYSPHHPYQAPGPPFPGYPMFGYQGMPPMSFGMMQYGPPPPPPWPPGVAPHPIHMPTGQDPAASRWRYNPSERLNLVPDYFPPHRHRSQTIPSIPWFRPPLSPLDQLQQPPTARFHSDVADPHPAEPAQSTNDHHPNQPDMPPALHTKVPIAPLAMKRIGVLGSSHYQPDRHEQALQLGRELAEFRMMARPGLQSTFFPEGVTSKLIEVENASQEVIQQCLQAADLSSIRVDFTIPTPSYAYRCDQVDKVCSEIRARCVSRNRWMLLTFFQIGWTYAFHLITQFYDDQTIEAESRRLARWSLEVLHDQFDHQGAYDNGVRPPLTDELYDRITALPVPDDPGSMLPLVRLLKELSKPMTVLFAYTAPRDKQGRRVGEERRDLKEVMLSVHYRNHLQVYDLPSCRIRDLNANLGRHDSPHIFHYSGHGSASGLYFEDNSGNAFLVDPADLGAILAEHKVQLAVLNASFSATHGQAVADQMRYAIGMECTIADDAAISFSRTFYEQLGGGDDVERAFRLADRTVRMEFSTCRPRLFRRGG